MWSRSMFRSLQPLLRLLLQSSHPNPRQAPLALDVRQTHLMYTGDSGVPVAPTHSTQRKVSLGLALDTLTPFRLYDSRLGSAPSFHAPSSPTSSRSLPFYTPPRISRLSVISSSLRVSRLSVMVSVTSYLRAAMYQSPFRHFFLFTRQSSLRHGLGHFLSTCCHVLVVSPLWSRSAPTCISSSSVTSPWFRLLTTPSCFWLCTSFRCFNLPFKFYECSTAGGVLSYTNVHYL